MPGALAFCVPPCASAYALGLGFVFRHNARCFSFALRMMPGALALYFVLRHYAFCFLLSAFCFLLPLGFLPFASPWLSASALCFLLSASPWLFAFCFLLFAFCFPLAFCFLLPLGFLLSAFAFSPPWHKNSYVAH
jgi:hypothetical protein